MKFSYQKLPFEGFDTRQPLIARPILPVYLHGKNHRTPSPYYALLDSGADKILMPAELAEVVGIKDFTKGRLEPTVGIANQRADVYYHDNLSIEIVGHSKKLSISIGFSDKIFLPILGRSFFIHFKSVIFSERKEEIELKD
ncbi:MAG: hypothetical protein AAB377_02480 [Patescibacteria group bacterium]